MAKLKAKDRNRGDGYSRPSKKALDARAKRLAETSQEAAGLPESEDDSEESEASAEAPEPESADEASADAEG